MNIPFLSQENNFNKSLRIVKKNNMGKTIGDLTEFDYHGQIKNGLREGLGRQCVHNDRIIEGFFKDDMVDGFARIIYLSGDYFEGNYKEAKKDGYGKHILSNGDFYEGIFKDGVSLGFGKMHKVDGTVREV